VRRRGRPSPLQGKEEEEEVVAVVGEEGEEDGLGLTRERGERAGRERMVQLSIVVPALRLGRL